MNRADWFAARKTIGMAMMDEGVSEAVAHRASYEVMTETHGVPPKGREWENADLSAAVEIGNDGKTVDVAVDDEWVFLTPADARAMAAALIVVADEVDAVVDPTGAVAS